MIRFSLNDARMMRWSWLLAAILVAGTVLLLDQPPMTGVVGVPSAGTETALNTVDVWPDRTRLLAQHARAEAVFAPPPENQPQVVHEPVPVVIATPPPPPPPPAPPELSVQYLGAITLQDGGVLYQFLRGERVLSMRAGDALDEHYVFEGADGANLVFLHKPLSVRQYLPARGN